MLVDQQYGFTSSYITQLLTTINDWMEMLDEKKSVNVTYLDLQKAVDNVPHKRLLTKLRGYSIHGKLLDWIKDFLSDRTQHVSVGGECSEEEVVFPRGVAWVPHYLFY